MEPFLIAIPWFFWWFYVESPNWDSMLDNGTLEDISELIDLLSALCFPEYSGTSYFDFIWLNGCKLAWEFCSLFSTLCFMVVNECTYEVKLLMLEAISRTFLVFLFKSSHSSETSSSSVGLIPAVFGVRGCERLFISELWSPRGITVTCGCKVALLIFSVSAVAPPNL